MDLKPDNVKLSSYVTTKQSVNTFGIGVLYKEVATIITQSSKLQLMYDYHLYALSGCYVYHWLHFPLHLNKNDSEFVLKAFSLS